MKTRALVIMAAAGLAGATPWKGVGHGSFAPKAPGLSVSVLGAALDAVGCARAQGEFAEAPTRLTVIDYSLPSTEPRLWVLDLHSGEVLFHEHVAHGQGTGDNLAQAFSNTEGSHMSSLGLFKTAETYTGRHGTSLRLDGLEPGFNDLARERAIVIHGAEYASEDFIAQHGRLGRSWGCPAVDDAVAEPLIQAIAGGQPLFAWYPEDQWLQGSPLRTCASGPG